MVEICALPSPLLRTTSHHAQLPARALPLHRGTSTRTLPRTPHRQTRRRRRHLPHGTRRCDGKWTSTIFFPIPSRLQASHGRRTRRQDGRLLLLLLPVPPPILLGISTTTTTELSPDREFIPILLLLHFRPSTLPPVDAAMSINGCGFGFARALDTRLPSNQANFTTIARSRAESRDGGRYRSRVCIVFRRGGAIDWGDGGVVSVHQARNGEQPGGVDDDGS
ncbi:hypothetical protein R3P38DRAFT_2958290 [Favolaschia claudopus]|uniref:Uncharacterized protein n=1 Tax=Favolaschia claudopus TaxID=2862362 RepID=A0AAW0BB62_9AGAR